MNKSFILFCVFLLFALTKAIPDNVIRYPITPFDDKTCEEGKTKCSDDCGSLILCPVKDEPKIISCNKQSGGKLPYCDKDLKRCVASPSGCTPEGGGGGTDYCYRLRDGFYPDLEDCTKYYYCASNKKISYSCNPNSNYNAGTTLCQTRLSCITFSGASSSYDQCRGHAGSLVGHPYNASLYIECPDPTATPPITKPILYDCPLPLTFDKNAAGCTFVCKVAGRFPDPLDDTMYYECSGPGASEYKKCPEKHKFDPNLQLCLPSGENSWYLSLH